MDLKILLAAVLLPAASLLGLLERGPRPIPVPIYQPPPNIAPIERHEIDLLISTDRHASRRVVPTPGAALCSMVTVPEDGRLEIGFGAKPSAEERCHAEGVEVRVRARDAGADEFVRRIPAATETSGTGAPHVVSLDLGRLAGQAVEISCRIIGVPNGPEAEGCAAITRLGISGLIASRPSPSPKP